ncbi:MAG: YfhO family protein [Acutalibacteraceae bacterium]
MDEQSIRTNEQAEESLHQTPPPVSAKQPLIQFVLMGIVFAAVTALVVCLTMGTASLTTTAQKVLYPALSGILLAALTVLWLYYQSFSSDKLNHTPKAWFFPVLGGALTLIVASIGYICIGMWPVGEKTAMIVDMHHQYAPMLSQLRDMLLNGGSPLYSFEIGTGTSFIPLFAYYLASPLNVLLILFPEAYLAEGILVITLIKMTLTGALMTLCLQYVFKRRSYATVVVGLMYALMMYMLAYSWNIMWLDCVMFLPLCIMGFERMMRTGKYLLYILSLAYTLYANYYIGFMVCIFLVLYYLTFFFRAKRSGIKQAVGFGRFAIGSLLGGGLAMVILIPVVMSLSSTSAAGGSLPTFSTNFNVFELFGRGLFETSPTIRSGNLPNMYCGVLAVLALPIFATMKSIPLRRRLSYLALLGVMGLSLIFNQLDLLWHGLHSPNDLPYRFSFLYCFALLLITYEVLYRIKDIKPIQIGGSLFGIAIYLILEEQFGTQEYSYISLYVSFALIAVYAAVMLFVAHKKMAVRCAYVLTLVFVTAEMLFNASATFQAMNSNEHYTSHSNYLDNDVTKAVEATVSRMEEIGDAEANGAFYRMEFLPRRTTADTAMFDYRGITVFASSGSYDMTRFMGSMGYDVNGVNSQLYKSFVPTADSLMGLKYIAMEADVSGHPQLQKRETVQVGGSTYYIYENPYALPVGFMVNSSVKSWQYSYYNPMASQNSLFSAMTGNTSEVMQCQQIVSESDTATVNGVSSFSMNGAQTASFRTTVSAQGQIYIHVDCRAAKSISVTSGSNTWSVTTYEPYIIDAGTLAAGSEVRVTITSENSCSGNIYVARLDENAFKQDMQVLSSNGLQVTSFNDSSLTGTIHVDEAGVMCTAIQYDEGWTVKVDGKKVDTFAIGDALLGIDLEAGDHEISLSFYPKGLTAGVILSVVSLLALLVLLDYVQRRDTGKGFIPFFNKKEKRTADK